MCQSVLNNQWKSTRIYKCQGELSGAIKGLINGKIARRCGDLLDRGSFSGTVLWFS